jgi:hypothetical protein
MDELVHTTLKSFQKKENEKVQDYYERFMKLIKCLQTNVREGFKLTYFQTTLLHEDHHQWLYNGDLQ